MTGQQLALIAAIREIDDQLADLATRRRELALELRDSARAACSLVACDPSRGDEDLSGARRPLPHAPGAVHVATPRRGDESRGAAADQLYPGPVMAQAGAA